MNLRNNLDFKRLFDSIKKRLDVNGEEDSSLENDIIDAINNMITAIEFGHGDEAFTGLFLPKMNRIFDRTLDAPAAISIVNNVVTLLMNPQLLFLICNDYDDFSAIIQHEVYHLVFKHLIPSRKCPNSYRANFAMDCSINQYINFSDNLKNSLITLEKFNALFKVNAESKREFEYYYELIPDDFANPDTKLKQMLKELADLKDKLNKNGGGSGSDSDDEENDSNGSNSNGGGSGSDSDDEENDNSSRSDSNGGGSGSDSNNEGNGSNDSSNESNSENKSSKSIQEQIDELKEKIKEYIKKHYVFSDIKSNESNSSFSKADEILLNEIIESTLNEAKERGKIPSGISSMIENLYFKDPIINWKNELRNVIGSIPCPYRKTMRVKNRRMPKRADLLGRVNDRKLRIAVAVDTSGSVSDNELKYFFNELFNIIKDMETEVTLIQCDATVSSVDIITKKQDVAKVKINGRGGTYFTPVFEYIKNDIPKYNQPSVIIYFTDGYGESQIPPEYKTHAEILWILTGYENHLSVQTPEYIKRVRLLNIENKKYL